jgi:phosphoribosylglycinamide formyltransferase 2
VVLGDGHSQAPAFEVDPGPLSVPDTALRLFGKPEVHGRRRMGVALALDASVEAAKEKALRAARAVKVEF